MTRQLLEDIKSHLLGEGTVFGINVDVVKSYSDDDNSEYTFDVKYKGKEIGYYHVNGDEDEPEYIEAYSKNSDEESTDEYDEHHQAVQWIVSKALDDGLISEGLLDKAKQMAMKFLQSAKSKLKKRFNWSQGLLKKAKSKGKKVNGR
jgi:hypothetical protein